MDTTENAIDAGLTGLGQLATVNVQNELFKQAIEQAANDLANAQSQLSQAELLEIRQLARRAGDPVVQDALRMSFQDLQSQIQNSINGAGTTMTKAAALKSALKGLGKAAGPAGMAITAVEIDAAIDSGDPERIGNTVTGAVAAGLGGAIGSAVAVAAGATAAVTVGAAVLGALIVTALVDAILPDELKKSVGEFYQNEVRQFTDFLEWLDPIGIGRDVADFFDSAVNFVLPPLPRDPLTLDLDGDGLETLSTAANVLFDQNADGVRTGTGWVAPDDGLLVRDINGNGIIDDGTELFGNSTSLNNGTIASDGFSALSDLDANEDGLVDSSDAVFSELRVWRDLNGDGISQGNELFTLAEVGITGLNTVPMMTDHIDLGNGNAIEAGAMFIRSDGTTGMMMDTNFDEDRFFREFITPVAVSDVISALPDVTGSGSVRDLREAAALSSDIESILSNYTQATTRNSQQALLDGLIFNWADTSSMQDLAETALNDRFILSFQFGNAATDTTDAVAFSNANSGIIINSPTELFDIYNQGQSATYTMWLDRLSALERFTGSTFLDFVPPAQDAQNFLVQVQERASDGSLTTVDYSVVQVTLLQQQIDFLDSSYQALSQSVYNSLLPQTRLAPLLNAVSLTLTSDGAVTPDFSGLENVIAGQLSTDPLNGLITTLEFMTLFGDSPLKAGWDGWSFVSGQLRTLTVTPEVQDILSEFVVTLMDSTSIQLDGTGLAEILLGNDLDNIVQGFDGNDVLNGAGGSDVLDGGNGNNTIYGGTGNDTITTGYGNDTIDGGAGDDTITDTGGSDAIDGGAGDDTITDAGGSDTVYGGAGNDVITLNGNDSADNNTVYAGDGNDTVVLSRLLSGNVVDGGAGDDVLLQTRSPWPGTANYTTTFIGGTGNDYLQGARGETTYIFNRGDGQDIIDDYDAGTGLLDRVVFGAGISASDLTAYRDVNDVVIQINDPADPTATDQIRIQQWYRPSFRIEQFEFADGTMLDTKAITDLSMVGTEGADVINGWNEASITIYGLGGNDTITSSWRNDTVYGGAGDDTITDAGGSDTVYGGAGNDVITLNGTSLTDNNTVYGGDGNDQVTLSIWSTNNVVDGGAGDDVLLQTRSPWPGTSNYTTTFIGGTGNDYLQGARGETTYIFNRGDGQDIINDYDAGSGLLDRVVFGAGISASDLTAYRDVNDVVIQINDPADPTATDQIKIQNWYNGSTYQLEQFEFVDGAILTNSQISALATNTIPVINNALLDQTILEDSLFSYQMPSNAFSDVEDTSAALNYTATLADGSALPVWLSFDAVTQTFTGTPVNGDVGNLDITVTATDSGGLSVSDTFALTVQNTNDAPTVSTLLLDQAVVENTAFAYTLPPSSFTDIDVGDSLSYSATLSNGSVLPAWLSFDAVTQTFNGTPANGDIGNLDVMVTATDSGGLSVSDTFALTVEGVTIINGTNVTETLYGTSGADDIRGYGGHDTVYGLAGDDLIKGGGVGDKLYGGAGNDIVNGEDGFDLIAGDEGTDILRGGAGSDTYLFNRGWGVDTIIDYDSKDAQPGIYGNTTDQVDFGANISPDQLWFSRVDHRLEISIIGTNDRVNLQNWYFGSDYRVDQFKTSDGSVLYEAQVEQLVTAMAAFSPPASGEMTLSPVLQAQLVPVITASWQSV